MPADSTGGNAIYARVSSDGQAKQQTIDSQVHALQKRVADDGLTLHESFCFLDDGFSGSVLFRPALERLRDQVAAGNIARLYVHSPDRLARKYAYQVLLLEEFTRHKVEVVFLNHPPGRSPEQDLLLQVQGMIAEYERAKILERSRRGKRQAARRGSLSVMGSAPYGYRYRPREAGRPQAAFEVHPEEAEVVRRIFAWVAEGRATIGQVARRLREQGVKSPKGQTLWQRSSLAGLLANPAYAGKATFGRTRSGPRRSEARPGARQAGKRPCAFSVYDAPEGEGIEIAVPALVSKEQFEAAAQQLAANKQRQRQSKRGASYLLQGLVVCEKCKRALYGKPVCSNYKGKKSRYTYYRCPGKEGYRFGGERQCDNRQVRTDRLEQAVWQDVCELLSDDKRLEEEYNRRGKGDGARESLTRQQLDKQLKQAREALGRLIDGYAQGLLEAKELAQRGGEARTRIKELEGKKQESDERGKGEERLAEVLRRWKEFASRVRQGLNEASWETKRQVLLAVVEEVQVCEEIVRVLYRVPGLSSSESSFQDCPNRAHASHPTK